MVDLIEEYSQDEGNTLRVRYDSNNEVTMIFIQFARQVELFALFGHLALSDGTYNMDFLGWTLQVILVQNSHGNGEPVAFALLRDETSDALMEFFNLFATVTDSSNYSNLQHLKA